MDRGVQGLGAFVSFLFVELVPQSSRLSVGIQEVEWMFAGAQASLPFAQLGLPPPRYLPPVREVHVLPKMAWGLDRKDN